MFWPAVIPVLAAVGGLTGYYYCSYIPCCNDQWIIKNFTGLERDLAVKLHGQHLVQNTVIGHIRGHLNSENPSKALVLSFHGLPGVGKNFVSQIVAENMYRGGLHSPYVHFISATNDFPHVRKVDDYKDQLKKLIEESVKKCERSLFIIDEVDKIPPTLLDVMKPYVDYHPHVRGVNYRKAIFIFLSNTGGVEIQRFVFDHWKSGKKREEITLKVLEDNVMLSTLNAEAHGLRHSQLIGHHLITAYIPFLPLEREHVKKCIKDDVVAKKRFRSSIEVPDQIVNEVMDELNFYPAKEQLFSTTGCKRVTEKVDLVLINA